MEIEETKDEEEEEKNRMSVDEGVKIDMRKVSDS